MSKRRIDGFTTEELLEKKIKVTDVSHIVSPGANVAEIQEAVDTMYELGGGDVVFGAGIYEISTEIVLKPHVNLKGNGDVIIQPADNFTVFPILQNRPGGTSPKQKCLVNLDYDYTYTPEWTANGNVIDGITFDGLFLVQECLGRSIATYTGVKHILVRNCVFKGASEFLINADNWSDYSVIEQCWFELERISLTQGLVLYPAATVGTLPIQYGIRLHSYNCTVSTCWFIHFGADNTSDPLEYRGDGPVSLYSDGKHTEIVNCRFDSDLERSNEFFCQFAKDGPNAPEDAKVSSCHFSGVATASFGCTGSGSDIVGLRLDKCTFEGCLWGVFDISTLQMSQCYFSENSTAYIGQCSQSLIEECYFLNNARALRLTGGADSSIRANFFRENTISHISFENGNSSRFTIAHNAFEETASRAITAVTGGAVLASVRYIANQASTTSGTLTYAPELEYYTLDSDQYAASGGESAPALSFNTARANGFFSESSTAIGGSIEGTQVYSFGKKALTLDGDNTGVNKMQVISAAATEPSAVMQIETPTAARAGGVLWTFTGDATRGAFFGHATDAGGNTDTLLLQTTVASEPLSGNVNSAATRWRIPYTGQLRGIGGSAAAPMFSFTQSTNSGLYYQANAVNISNQGSQKLNITATDANFSDPVHAPNGTAAVPSIGFTSDPDTGLYRVGTNAVGVSGGGVPLIVFQSPAILASTHLLKKATQVTSTPYSATTTDHIIVLGSGASVVNLPFTASALFYEYTFINNSGGAVTINRGDNNTIGAAKAVSYNLPNDRAVKLQSNGANGAAGVWMVFEDQ